jgi:hypothetical protein
MFRRIAGFGANTNRRNARKSEPSSVACRPRAAAAYISKADSGKLLRDAFMSSRPNNSHRVSSGSQVGLFLFFYHRSCPMRKNALPPKFTQPQLSLLVKAPPSGADWAHELKYDGYRIQVRLVQGEAADANGPRLDGKIRGDGQGGFRACRPHCLS